MNQATFHVLIFAEANPEHVADCEEILKSLVEPARAEAGCRQYEIYRDTQHQTKFTIIETWDTAEHYHAHLQTPPVLAAIKEAGEKALLAKPWITQTLQPI
jgi:quinol monooxygenase YgiN